MLNVDGQHSSTFILHCLIMMSVKVGLFVIMMVFFCYIRMDQILDIS